MTTDEILYFRRPPLEARLVCVDLAPQVAQNELFELFNTFGHLQSLIINGENAFIDFYSPLAASKAFDEIGLNDGNIENPAAPWFHGKRLKLKSRKPTANDSKFERLMHQEAVSMANVFFGFDGWTSSVQELTEIKMAFDGENTYYEENTSSSSGSPSSLSSSSHSPQSHWFAIVEVQIPKHNIKVTGRGYGLSGGEIEDGFLIGQAKKAAINLARVNALQRLCLVLLDGRVRYIHMLPLEELIETSIIWQSSLSARPDPASLPCSCEDYQDDEAHDNGGVHGKCQQFLDQLDQIDLRTPAGPSSNFNKTLKSAIFSSSFT